MTSILATKLYMPSPRPQLVRRSHLLERLNGGLHRKLTLISAPAGFGKTTLVSEWLSGCVRPSAWLSLDERDKDPTRFLTYLIAAVQTLISGVAADAAEMLEAPSPMPVEAILTALLNDLASLKDQFILVLDDYHELNARSIDQALTYLIEHLPPQMHLVIVTREDPELPLARFRARDHVTEIRVADLRFSSAEAAEFLTRVMSLSLTASDVAALEIRTEGWIAGLQLAALSLQGHPDTAGFIRSFTGSHQYVMDYLVEEVLHQHSQDVQDFLLRTSILERLSGPLCEAVLLAPSGSGQTMLDYLDHANLFLIPLDLERRWHRYHHLFAELLRQRLHQSIGSSPEEVERRVIDLHLRASHWYEEQGLALEAFHHAAAAGDVDLAARLIEGRGIPLHFQGAVTAMLDWMASLSQEALEARPRLLVRYAALMLVNGQATGVEEKLRIAEAILEHAEPNDSTRDLIGQIATARATLATNQYQLEPMLVQSRRALEYLYPGNLVFRTTAYWTLGVAHSLQGDRVAARQAYTEAISISEMAGINFFRVFSTTGLAQIQEADTQLYPAAETYRNALRLAGDQPLPTAYEPHLGLARICYEWNDLEAALEHGKQSLRLARQYDSPVDRFVACEIFLARLKLAEGNVVAASRLLAEARRSAQRQHFEPRLSDVAAIQVLAFLRQGQLPAARKLADIYALPLCQARVWLAEGDPAAALEILEPLQANAQARGWADESLKILVLEALALQARGDQEQAVRLLLEALALSEPGGFIRTFVDEGAPLARLLSAAVPHGMMVDYIGKLLAVCEAEARDRDATTYPPLSAGSLIEPLTRREREVLQLIAKGLSNQEIAEQLVLSLETVKGHNTRIFGKLQVQRRTEAVARARELGLV